MLADERFEPARGSFGLEIELNLTDDDGRPALANAAVLEAIADPDFQTELGQFNIEINIAPRLLAATRLRRARGVGPRRASTTPRSARARPART